MNKEYPIGQCHHCGGVGQELSYNHLCQKCWDSLIDMDKPMQPPVQIICGNCRRTFIVWKSQRVKGRKFCTEKCRKEYANKGIKQLPSVYGERPAKGSSREYADWLASRYDREQ